jgi:hypothetical protein
MPLHLHRPTGAKPPHALTGNAMNTNLTTAASAPGIRPLADLTPLFELDRIVVRVLADMGLGTATTSEDVERRADFADFSVLHFVILPQRSTWLDFMLETDRQSAQRIFESFSGSSDATDSDLADVLRETVNMIHGSLKASFRDAGVDVIIPLVPQSIESEKLTGDLGGCSLQNRYAFRLPGISLRFTMIVRVAPITQKELKHFRLAEVLVGPISAGEDQEVAIVKKHTMLNRRLLEKVRNMAAFQKEPTIHAVIEPSPLAVMLPNE